MTTPAGWHPDPDGSPQLRWWDGRKWTSDVELYSTKPAPTGSVTQAAVDSEPSKPTRKAWPRIVGAVAVLVIIIGLFTVVTRSPENTASTAPAVTQPSASAATSAISTSTVASTVALPSIPVVTPQYDDLVSPGDPAKVARQAAIAQHLEPPGIDAGPRIPLVAAQKHLDYIGFSRQGLIDQLEFENYSTEDATDGVDQAAVDWRVQAERVARDYLQNGSFTRQGLFDQLVHDGFEDKEARAGVEEAGL